MRRGNGEGSIYRRRGKWQVALTVGARRVYRTARTKQEADRLLTELKRTRDLGGTPAPVGERVEALAARYLEVTRARVKPRTLDAYALCLTRAMPHIGQMPVTKVSGATLDRLYATLQADGLAARTVKQTATVLHAMFGYAVLHGDLMANPSEKSSPPKPPRTELHVLTADETRTLLAHTADEPLGECVTLLALTGMRVGEALGLMWEDVDLDAARLTVRRTLTYHDRTLTVGSPKTAGSSRTVALSAPALDALRRQRKATGRIAGLIFTREDGSPVPFWAVTRTLDRCLAAAGLPHIRVHDLRHGVASMLLSSGVSPKVVAEMLGHSVTMLLTTYSHVAPVMHDDAADAVARMVVGA